VDVVPPQVGDSVQTRLLIPRLNLDIPVVVAPVVGESWQVDHLQQAAGHLAGTAAPGANSNAVLAGHVSLLDGSPGPFAQLNQLAPTDELWLVQGQQRFRYVVDRRQVVEPAAIEVTYPTETARITLITCDGWNDADGRYVNRLVVAGFLVDG
jgi:LPXTG-site transpeptidase (sortase) family protein